MMVDGEILRLEFWIDRSSKLPFNIGENELFGKMIIKKKGEQRLRERMGMICLCSKEGKRRWQ